MIRIFLTLAAVVLCVFVAIAVVRALQRAAPERAAILDLLTERIARGGGVGLVLGTVDAGQPRVVAAGRTGAAGSAAVDERTIFEIGSVSKVFTTTLLAEMVVRGEVALDDPIDRFLPSSVRVPSRDGKAITLLDLATATSGLPSLPDNFAPRDAENLYADYDAPRLYAFLSGYTLPRAPGAAYGTRTSGWACSVTCSSCVGARPTRRSSRNGS